MTLQQPAQYRAGSPVSLFAFWAIVAFAGLLLYGCTAQQGVSWQDSGMLQWRILAGDYTGCLGLALAHPLYIAIGRLFLFVPFVSDVTMLSLCSGAGMAVTLANLSVLGWMLTGKRWIGLMTAGMLSVTHTPWWLSTITEVYTWNAAFFTAELIVFMVCIRRPSRVATGALFLLAGLNIGVHNMALLSLPVYTAAVLIWVWRRRLTLAALPIAGAAGLCGAGPLLALVIQEAVRTGDLRSALASMLFSRYSGAVFNFSPGGVFMGINAALSSLNFMHAGLILGIVGWLRMRSTVGTWLACALSALLGLHGLFFLRYSVPDQFTFILPSLVLFCLGMAVGIDVLARRSALRAKMVVAACFFSIVLMPLTYAALPPVLNALGLRAMRTRSLPFRDEMRYWIEDWKHTENSAVRFARAALKEASPDGIIVCDGTSYYPLVLMRDRTRGAGGIACEHYSDMRSRYGANPDALKSLLRERGVFIVSPALNFISEEFRPDFELIRGLDDILFMLLPGEQAADGGGRTLVSPVIRGNHAE